MLSPFELHIMNTCKPNDSGSSIDVPCIWVPSFPLLLYFARIKLSTKKTNPEFKKRQGIPNPQRSKIVKSTQKLEIEPYSSLLFRNASHLFVFFPQRQRQTKTHTNWGREEFSKRTLLLSHNNKTHIRQHIRFVCEAFFLDETPRSTFFFSSLGTKFQYPSGTFSFPLLLCFCSCFLWLWRKFC